MNIKKAYWEFGKGNLEDFVRSLVAFFEFLPEYSI